LVFKNKNNLNFVRPPVIILKKDALKFASNFENKRDIFATDMSPLAHDINPAKNF